VRNFGNILSQFTIFHKKALASNYCRYHFRYRRNYTLHTTAIIKNINLYLAANMTLNKLLETQGIIHSDPEIMSGVPVFVGTRVPLQTLFDYLESEGGLADFINDFPYLETQTMKVLENAAKLIIAQERCA
jgi:uncharacterized protein (DUF433 family)